MFLVHVLEAEKLQRQKNLGSETSWSAECGGSLEMDAFPSPSEAHHKKRDKLFLGLQPQICRNVYSLPRRKTSGFLTVVKLRGLGWGAQAQHVEVPWLPFLGGV